MTATDNAAVARECVLSGTPPLLLLCSASSESLSASARDFVRDLRQGGARVEFHAPGDAESLLQSANRLLAEIPLESLLASGKQNPPHLLIIDDAESLSSVEAASLRRIVQGLRGSPFRTLLLARCTRAGLQRLPISEVTDLAMIWDIDGLGESEIELSADMDAPVIPSVPMPPPVVTPAVATPTVATPKVAAPTAAAIPDVLAELARERAETRGFDVTSPRRWLTMPVKAVAAVVAVLLIGYAVQSAFLTPSKSSSLVYDCGLHGDRESVDVLIARIGRTTPTRVTNEAGRFRLQVGPFASESAAAAARTQVWRLGACRVEPAVARAAVAPKRKTGG